MTFGPCFAQTQATAEKFKIAARKESALFEAAKGKLPYPVKNGIIVADEHAPISIVPTPAHELHFEADDNANIYAVFDGDITNVMEAEGKNVVMIRHGLYFTAYINVGKVAVTKGQHVSRNETIGTITAQNNKKGTLIFQIWQADEKSGVSHLPPEEWLIARGK